MAQPNHSIQSMPCIINPRASSYRWKRSFWLRRMIQKRLTSVSSRSKEESIRRAKELSLTNEFLVVIGGDGTISDVIQGIFEAGTGSRVRLGIVPLGSGNAFQRSLGIPRGTKQSLQLLTEGRVRPIDVIKVNGRIGSFINIGGTAACGYYAHKNFAPGWLGHFLSIWPHVFYQRHMVKVELEDVLDSHGRHFDRLELKLCILDCTVTKIQYFGYGWKNAPLAVPDDGYLDITFYEMQGPAFLSMAPFIYLGLLQRNLRRFKAKRMVMRGRRLPIQYNGEDLPRQDVIEMTVIPKAVQVIVPDRSKNKRPPQDRD